MTARLMPAHFGHLKASIKCSPPPRESVKAFSAAPYMTEAPLHSDPAVAARSKRTGTAEERMKSNYRMAGTCPRPPGTG